MPYVYDPDSGYIMYKDNKNISFDENYQIKRQKHYDFLKSIGHEAEFIHEKDYPVVRTSTEPIEYINETTKNYMGAYSNRPSNNKFTDEHLVQGKMEALARLKNVELGKTAYIPNYIPPSK